MKILYFEGSVHLRLLRIIRSCVLIQGKTTKHTWEKNGVYGDNVKTIAISEIYSVC
jgi:hypothetical protein